jgi:hypothetical protein
MVCLGNICINTLQKGAKDDNNNNNNNNNNMLRSELTTIFRMSPGTAYTGTEAAIDMLWSFT